MGEEAEIDSPAFIRQRRNLIIASLVLAFAQGTHLSIHKVAFFGVEANIDGPVSTLPYLWILFGYFLWRYWQAFIASHAGQTKVHYRKTKKTFVERMAVSRILPRLEGKLRDGQEPKAWMPHDEETRSPTGARVTIVANLAERDNIGGMKQQNLDVELTRGEIRRIRLRALRYLIVTSNEFSEYYLPFFVACFPVAILAWQTLRKWG